MESNRTVDENTRLDLSDCSLWRTKVNSTQFVEDDDEKTLETNLALTDCSLWRTRVRGSDAFADTNPRPSDVQSVNRKRFEVTDNSLRRTRIRESSASGESDSGVSAVSQTVAETQQQPTSPVAQKTHFEVTDNSLYRTQMRVSEVPVADEMEEETNEEEKTIRSPSPTPALSITEEEAPHRRRRMTYEKRLIDPQQIYDLCNASTSNEENEETRSSTATALYVTDCSLWRTRVRGSDASSNSNPPQSISNSQAVNRTSLEVTDNSLYRTQVRLSELQLVNETAKTVDSNLDVSDCSLWRTKVDAIEDPNEEPGVVSQIDFTINESDISTNTTISQSFQGRRKSRVSKGLANLHPVMETIDESVGGRLNEFVGSQSPSDATMHSISLNNLPETPRRSAASRFSRGYAEPTIASLSRSIDNSDLVEVLNVSKDKCKRTMSQTQTSEKNDARRKTINPLTQHIVPLSPRRRATMLNPSKLPNAPRVSVFAPFFNRLSTSGSEPSSRPSVGSNSSLLSGSPTSKIPVPSPKQRSKTPSTPKTSPRLVDRVRVNEALKCAGLTPRSTRSRLPTRLPSTPPKNERVEKRHREAGQSNALRLICVDYTTPDRNRKEPLNESDGGFYNLSSAPSTPEHSQSTFNATEPPRSGPISSQPLRLASKQRTLQWHEDEAGSIFDPVPNPAPIESQQIASQVPLKRPPFRLLNDDDFTIGSPFQPTSSKQKSPAAEVARCVPNDSHFNENSILSIDLDETIHEETFGQSFVAGVSDYDSDVASPAPKHIVLRKPAKKAEKYLRAVKPKILIGADEIRDQHPELRRSSRTRLSRPCNRGLGERPIYARDSQGNFCLVGVQEGRTADPLCKKWGTFDKEKAIEMDKAAGKRRRFAKEVNREKWRRDFHGQ
ncbi:hypothetical protein M3Y98_01033800 [Aphelenchoides besseyi]|nr:hypothetical protein M3Y98_01033800 [Aphelenchoides besseyi]KAI6209944.1 hypothetical protein M3Y96_00274700 [Aphelenchoides besseyi]